MVAMVAASALEGRRYGPPAQVDWSALKRPPELDGDALAATVGLGGVVVAARHIELDSRVALFIKSNDAYHRLRTLHCSNGAQNQVSPDYYDIPSHNVTVDFYTDEHGPRRGGALTQYAGAVAAWKKRSMPPPRRAARLRPSQGRPSLRPSACRRPGHLRIAATTGYDSQGGAGEGDGAAITTVTNPSTAVRLEGLASPKAR
jgi:hypothetical protein